MQLRVEMRLSIIFLLIFLLFSARTSVAQKSSSMQPPNRVILDTDIGDDIDDAFALALALSSPDIQLMGITTAWGETSLRARLVKRFLCETGENAIPVFSGVETPAKAPFTQRAWAQKYPGGRQLSPGGIDFILNTIRHYPGQVTLISIAPLSNVGALIDKDPATFHKLKKVIIMGGSIKRGYGDLGFTHPHGPDPEYNILMDVASANKLLASGVPLYMMPLDSTQLKLDEVKRTLLFASDTPMTNALAGLYYQWRASTQNPTPTLFDAMAVAYDLRPSLCPTTPLRIHVDSRGYTRAVPGTPNANVCLQSNSAQFFAFYIPRILDQHLAPRTPSSDCTSKSTDSVAAAQ